jgi:3-methyladenine DNA glycosylase/8-oxoguanine DNA glycosylase
MQLSARELPVKNNIQYSVPEDFDFWLTVWSSGWIDLAPFSYDEEKRTMSRIQRLTSGKIIRATMKQVRRGVLIISVESGEELDNTDIKEVEQMTETCLKLDEDLTPFYSMLEEYPEYSWAAEIGAGRSIRCPTVFEDVVKTICTTNASWSLTRGITRRLCERLGESFSGRAYSFPTPEQLSSTTEEFLRSEVKSGYRSTYIIELAWRIVDGELDIEAWKDSPTDSVNLKREVTGVKGVGAYAADNILKLLGRYDFLALDSWMRKKFAEIHNNGLVASDKEIEEFYAPFGEWKGLVLSLDVTKDHLVKAAQKTLDVSS